MSTGNTPDLVLVDGSSYLYRAFHALPPLTNSAGEPTGAVHGVLNMLLKFLRDYAPARVAVVFDAPGRTFRDELFAEYKAQRPPMPDELRSQIAPLLEAVEALGLPVLRVPGVEADDVIGTLARQAAQRGARVLISTGDKDMAQLVDEHVTLINTMSGSVLDRAGVKAKFDVYPEQIIDYLALVGDASDNIPGIAQVGPKTAAKWLKQYGSLEQIIAHAAEVPGKAGENLRAGLAVLALSRDLATIRCDLALPPQAADLQRRDADRARLRAIYRRLELRSLLGQLDAEDGRAAATEPGAAPGPVAAPAPEAAPAPDAAVAGAGGPADPLAAALAQLPRHYETILEWPALERWLEALRAAELFAFDTETTSLDYMTTTIVGVSFCIEPGVAAYVPLAHDYDGAPPQLDRQRVLAALAPLLQDAGHPKLGQHLKFDMHVLANHGIALSGQRYDTMLESYVLNSTATRHDMDSMAGHYLGLRTIHFEDVAGKGARQVSFSKVEMARAAEYAAEDADVTMRLHRALWPRIAQQPALEQLYRTIEQPLVPVLQRMERHGVLIDRDMLQAQSAELLVRLEEIAAEAHAAAGAPFNLDSPRQLQQILFERQQLPVLRKTPGGAPSTAEDVLEELAADHPLPRLILDYRALVKLRSTYTLRLPEQINPGTGRVHTSYHQAVAATGRLSSTDPNLQNIPIRSPEGRRIRQAFIAAPGYRLVAADYSQIELRIMAHLSARSRTAAGLRRGARHPPGDGRGSLRRAAGAGQRRAAPFGQGDQFRAHLRHVRLRAGAPARASRAVPPRVTSICTSRATRECAATWTGRASRPGAMGYVETVFGRRLFLPEIGSRNRALQQYAERSAINAPMQGTAADIIKRAMIDVDAWCMREQPPVRLIMQVHDELVLEVREDFVQQASREVGARMSAAAQLAVPLRVDIGSGANWTEAH